MKLIKYYILLVMSIMIGILTGCQGVEEKQKTEVILKNEASFGEETNDSEEKNPKEQKEGQQDLSDPKVEQQGTEQEISRIVCWGDSLTFGQGGEGVTFPSVLAELLPGVQVKNYGIQGETAKQIAIRAGVLPMTVSAFTIPQDNTPVQVYLWQNGEDPIMMRLGDVGINPCSIAGVEGVLSYDPDEIKYYFTRTVLGEAVEVADHTNVITFGDADKLSSDVIILFAGTNRAPDKNTVQELVDLERQMLEYIGSERYVIIGLTSKELVPDVVEINQALGQAFGGHFLDIRSYLLENGLEDAGLEATDQDLKDMGQGEIPSSLRVDVVHGNSAFYRLIGEQVYEKIRELGYISP
ncbi:MAG: SGNH/GDSL hydrolase family protein [Roseburia sp.]|nr:SGNH/GDSL hydrolase family protein [Roseburia sp.]